MSAYMPEQYKHRYDSLVPVKKVYLIKASGKNNLNNACSVSALAKGIL
jgi:hypothetical protein